MTGYIIRRVLLLGLTLLVTSALVFALTQIVPGADPEARVRQTDDH